MLYFLFFKSVYGYFYGGKCFVQIVDLFLPFLPQKAKVEGMRNKLPAAKDKLLIQNYVTENNKGLMYEFFLDIKYIKHYEW